MHSAVDIANTSNPSTATTTEQCDTKQTKSVNFCEESNNAGRSSASHTDNLDNTSQDHILTEACIKSILSNPTMNPKANDNELIRTVIKQGNINIVNLLWADSRLHCAKFAEVVMQAACEVDQMAVVGLVLDKYPLNLNISRVALTTTCRHGRTNILGMLLTDNRVHAAAYVGKDTTHLNAYLAGENQHSDTVVLLLTHPRTKSYFNKVAAFEFYCLVGNLERARDLIADSQMDPSSNGNVALRFASKQGHIVIIRMLIADPRVANSGGGHAALVSACKYNRLDVVKLLLQNTDVVVTKEALDAAECKVEGNVNNSNNEECVISVLMAKQPTATWAGVLESARCEPEGALHMEARRWAARSAKILLLVVMRTQTHVVAGRVNDVMRVAMCEFANFG